MCDADVCLGAAIDIDSAGLLKSRRRATRKRRRSATSYLGHGWPSPPDSSNADARLPSRLRKFANVASDGRPPPPPRLRLVAVRLRARARSNFPRQLLRRPSRFPSFRSRYLLCVRLARQSARQRQVSRPRLSARYYAIQWARGESGVNLVEFSFRSSSRSKANNANVGLVVALSSEARAER